MASSEYDDWDEPFKDVWDEIPGIPYAEDWEQDHLESLFEKAFMRRSDEAGYSADAVHEAREEFFEFLGLAPEDFPWEEWRAAMGYE